MFVDILGNLYQGSKQTLSNLQLPDLHGIAYDFSVKNDAGEGYEFKHIENNWTIGGDVLVVTFRQGAQEIVCKKWIENSPKSKSPIVKEGYEPFFVNTNYKKFLWLDQNKNGWQECLRKVVEGREILYDIETYQPIAYGPPTLNLTNTMLRWNFGLSAPYWPRGPEDALYIDMIQADAIKYSSTDLEFTNVTRANILSNIGNNRIYVSESHGTYRSAIIGELINGAYSIIDCTEYIPYLVNRAAFSLSLPGHCSALEQITNPSWAYVLTKNFESGATAIGLTITSGPNPSFSHSLWANIVAGTTIKNAFDIAVLQNPFAGSQRRFAGDVTATLPIGTTQDKWIYPSSYIDANSTWHNEEYSYDYRYCGNVAGGVAVTYSQVYYPAVNTWTNFIEYFFPSSTYDKLHVLFSIPPGNNFIYDIDLFYNGNYNDFFQGESKADEFGFQDRFMWFDLVGNQQNTTKVRIRSQSPLNNFAGIYSDILGEIRLETTSTGITTNYNIRIATSAANLNDPSTCFDSDSTENTTSYFSNFLNNGVTYYWKVRKYSNGAWGNFSDIWSFTNGTTTTLPTVTNSSGATAVGATSARLNGIVTNDGGGTTTTYIYYSIVDYGSSYANWNTYATKISMGVETANTSFFSDVSSLTTHTTYYYRCYATNSAGGTLATSTSTFTTISAMPTIVDSGITNLSNYTVTLNGYLTTSGLPSTVHAYWGLVDGGTTAANWDNYGIFVSSTDTGFYIGLSGLVDTKKYYYRFYASNSSGSVWDTSTHSFITLHVPVNYIQTIPKIAVGMLVTLKSRGRHFFELVFAYLGNLAKNRANRNMVAFKVFIGLIAKVSKGSHTWRASFTNKVGLLITKIPITNIREMPLLKIGIIYKKLVAQLTKTEKIIISIGLHSAMARTTVLHILQTTTISIKAFIGRVALNGHYQYFSKLFSTLGGKTDGTKKAILYRLLALKSLGISSVLTRNASRALNLATSTIGFFISFITVIRFAPRQFFAGFSNSIGFTTINYIYKS